MTFLKEQAIRLLRTKWNSAQELAEELFAIFNNDRPMIIDGDLQVNGSITSTKDGQSTTIDPTVPEPEPDPIPPPPAAVLFADGSDGDVAVTTEINLSRDMFYKNLTLSGAGKINTKNYRIFVSEILDLTGAGTDAINNKGNHGQYEDPNTYPFYFTATNTTIPETAHTCGTGCRGGAGGAGAGPAAGTAATPQPAYTAVGGRSAPGGQGGSADSGTQNGAAGGGGQLTSGQVPVSMAQTTPTSFNGTGFTLLQGGAGGGGGGGGAGSGTVPATTGIAGGSGGNGGGVLAVLARTIQVGSGTAAGALNANGGNGGNAPITGDTGSAGGGGGGGGGGGYVFLIYGEILGQASTNWIQCNGGRGGNGTKGWPSRGCTGGQGGNGGGSGAITLIDYYNSVVTQYPRSSGVGNTPSIPIGSEQSYGTDGITNEISLSEEA